MRCLYYSLALCEASALKIFGRSPRFFGVVLLGSYPTLTSACIGRLYLFHFTERRKTKSEARKAL
jgi:hypothetical protein